MGMDVVFADDKPNPVGCFELNGFRRWAGAFVDSLFARGGGGALLAGTKSPVPWVLAVRCELFNKLFKGDIFELDFWLVDGGGGLGAALVGLN